jgi:hypothetical protein
MNKALVKDIKRVLKENNERKLNSPDVSNRRELLNGFRKFINENTKEGYAMPYLIDKYLETI